MRDEAKALKLYQKAADQDDPRARRNLGLYYATGKGGLYRDCSAAFAHCMEVT